MMENQFNDYTYRYNNVDIQTYINAKKDDRILCYGQLYKVLVNSTSPSTIYIKIHMINNDGSSSGKVLYIKHLIYCYYNNITSIPKDTKVINLNENLFDNRIENLRLIKNIFTEHDVNDLSFRYKYIDNTSIKILENAKLGDKIPLYDRFYTVSLERSRLSVRIWYNDENDKQTSQRLPLKSIIYQYYNNVDIPEGYYIFNIDGDKYNNHIENLRLTTFNISEDQFYSWDYRYKYINEENIKSIENSKIGDRIPFGSKTYSVLEKDTSKFSTIITVTVTDKNNPDKSNKIDVPIRSIVYGFYNKCLSVPEESKIHYLNGDRSDNRIENIRLVGDVIDAIDYSNWEFRYRYINDDNINSIIYAKVGDKIPYCDRLYTVGNDGRGRKLIYVSTSNCDKDNMYIHRIIYEYYNRCILNDEDVIHHIDHDRYNNHIYNLKLVTHKEHLELHRDEVKNILVINIRNNILYGSLNEASKYEEIPIYTIKDICDGRHIRKDLQYYNDFMLDRFIHDWCSFNRKDDIIQEFSVENIQYYEKIESDDEEYYFPPTELSIK